MEIQRMKTNSPLDKLLNGGIEFGVVTNLYGPAGSGKTNIAMTTALSCLNSGKNMLYIDTEGGFSVERFCQLSGSEDHLKNVILVEPTSWTEQHEKVLSLEEIVEKNGVGLIVIDSIVALYRLELDDQNFHVVNRQLATEYSVLSKIARKHRIPVLVTNQVYSSEGTTEMTSKTVSKYWSKALVELKKTDRDHHRIAILRKHRSVPEGRNIEFEITKDGLKSVGKFDIF